MSNTFAHSIMIQGTMSNAGKSLVVAALCRIFRNEGYRIAPFKSQNMALNSGVTLDGLEMGRAQIMQAQAAGIEADVRMNPILLKPTSHHASQVIVLGEPVATMKAQEYFSYRTSLIPKIKEAYYSLASEHDIIIIEGAGSPAEINLRANDIVNMGLAELLDVPVLLVGDIDRGGVFASLYGTVELISKSERNRIKGFLINKFRGSLELLQDGLTQIAELTKIPVLGVIPFIERLYIDDEDSLSEQLITVQKKNPLLHIAVVRLPYISNFTDFNALTHLPFVQVSFFESLEEYNKNEFAATTVDLLILPGTKNTINALLWLRQTKIDTLIQKLAKQGTPIIGICGGFQLLGDVIYDTDKIENTEFDYIKALSLLPVKTIFTKEKTHMQVTQKLPNIKGFFKPFSHCEIQFYEIHHGKTILLEEENSDHEIHFFADDCILGTYAHGLFDNDALLHTLLTILAKRKGSTIPEYQSYSSLREQGYERLAEVVSHSVDIKTIKKIIGC